ncbi:MAG: hypothetical protein O3A00_08950 [Planctomycetota bacterium]|nr:hypothetical protein [Planctomycetota bacterium]
MRPRLGEQTLGNQMLLVTGPDASARVYSTIEGRELQSIASAATLRSATFTPNGRAVLIGGDEQRIHTWRFISPIAVRSLTGHGGGVYGVAFSPDGKLVASCSADATVHIWNAETGDQIRSMTGHAGLVSAIDFSPDGALLTSGGADNSVRLWDVSGGRQLKQLAALEGPCTPSPSTQPAPVSRSPGRTRRFRSTPSPRVSYNEKSANTKTSSTESCSTRPARGCCPAATAATSACGTRQTARHYSAK